MYRIFGIYSINKTSHCLKRLSSASGSNRGRGTLTELYQSSASETKYWSFPKFLSRGKWSADAVAGVLIRRIQHLFEDWVYVYDETKALKTGNSQWGLHFFRNFSYQKHRVNQSKFHFGHEFGALGLLCATATDWQFFPVWVKLMVPQTIRDKSYAVLKRMCSKIPPGLIIFDRGFAWRKVFTMENLEFRTSYLVSGSPNLMPSSIVYRNTQNAVSAGDLGNMETVWIFADCGMIQ